MADPGPTRTLRWAETDVSAGPLRLHVRRVVEPGAPPILLLHGLGVGGLVWQAFARRLLPEHAAVAPDLRGHGGSDAPATGYLPGDYARDLALLLESETHARPLPVLGHSLGALVAVALASGWPDKVQALVLVDPPLDSTISNPDVAEVYRRRKGPPGELEEYLLATNPSGGAALARSLATLFRQAANPAYEALLAAPLGHPATWAEAAALAQPTLLVQADPARGGLLGDEAAGRFTSMLRGGKLQKIAGAAHAVHASQPAELAATARAFLQRSA